MKLDKTDKILIIIILICFGSLFFLNKCSKTKDNYIKPDTHVIDSLNTVLDSIDDRYANNLLKLYDSIDLYKSRLKSKKTAFKTKYVFLDKNDTTAYLEDYRQCCFDANDIIVLQDSLIQIYDTAVTACNNRVINLKAQVQENKTVIKEIEIENPKYKKQKNKLLVLSLVLLGLFIVK